MRSRVKDAHIKTDSFDVHIVGAFERDTTDIYIIDKRHGQRQQLKMGENNEIISSPIVELEQPKPFLSISGRDSELVFALAEAFTEVLVERPTDSKIEGLYEAQSKHLEDMRKLVFKDDSVV